jgi:hypothetical protein
MRYQTSGDKACHQVYQVSLVGVLPSVYLSSCMSPYLPVEMCEESEVSELSPPGRSGVAQKRLRFVFFEFLWRGERLGKVTK